jgi:hypothetical protein
MQILAISGSLALLPPIQRSSKPLPPWLQRMSQPMSFAGSVISRTPPHAAVAEFRLQLGKSAGVIFLQPGICPWCSGGTEERARLGRSQ